MISFNTPRSLSEERKLIYSQTVFEVSLKSLSSPFPQQDQITASSASASADPFAVELTAPILELKQAIVDGVATSEMFESARVEIELIAAQRLAKYNDAFSQFQDHKMQIAMERAVAQAVAKLQSQNPHRHQRPCHHLHLS